MSETANTGLSLDALVGSLKTTDNFTDLSTQVQELKKAKEQVKTPLSKVARERIERKVAFSNEKENVSLWNGIVKTNRQSKQLRFQDTASERPSVTYASLASKFKPTNSLEKEVEVVCKTKQFNKSLDSSSKWNE